MPKDKGYSADFIGRTVKMSWPMWKAFQVIAQEELRSPNGQVIYVLSAWMQAYLEAHHPDWLDGSVPGGIRVPDEVLMAHGIPWEREPALDV